MFSKNKKIAELESQLTQDVVVQDQKITEEETQSKLLEAVSEVTKQMEFELESQKSKFEERVVAQNAIVSQMETEIEQSNNEVGELQSQLAEVGVEITELRSQLAEVGVVKDLEIAELNSKLKSLEEKLEAVNQGQGEVQQLKKQLVEFEKIVADQEEEVSDKMSEIAQLQAKLSEISQTAQDTDISQQSIQTDLSSLRTELQSRHKIYAEKMTENSDVIDQLQQQVSDQCTLISELEKQVAEIVDIKGLQKEVEVHLNEIQQLKAQIEESNRSKQEVQQIKKELDVQGKQNEMLKAEIATRTAEFDEHFSAFEEEFNQKVVQLLKQTEEIEELKTLTQQQETELNEKILELEQMKNSLNETSITGVSEAADEVERLKAELSSQQEDFEEKFTSLESEFKERLIEVQNASKLNREASEETDQGSIIESLKEQLVTQQEQFDQRFNEQEEEFNKKLAELDILKAKLIPENPDGSEIEELKQRLTQQQQEFNDEFAAQEEELDEYKQKVQELTEAQSAVAAQEQEFKNQEEEFNEQMAEFELAKTQLLEMNSIKLRCEDLEKIVQQKQQQSLQAKIDLASELALVKQELEAVKAEKKKDEKTKKFTTPARNFHAPFPTDCSPQSDDASPLSPPSPPPTLNKETLQKHEESTQGLSLFKPIQQLEDSSSVYSEVTDASYQSTHTIVSVCSAPELADKPISVTASVKKVYSQSARTSPEKDKEEDKEEDDERKTKKQKIVAARVDTKKVIANYDGFFPFITAPKEVAKLMTAPPASERKIIQGELARLRKIISSTNDEWEVRTKALKSLEQMVREQGVAHMPGWDEEMEKFKRGIAVQLADLRSQVVKQACSLLVVLAEAMSDDFEDHLAYFLPTLFNGLFVTIKILSESCNQCITALLLRTHSPKSISPLLAGGFGIHAIVRRRCSEYLAVFFEQCQSKPIADEKLQPVLPKLTELIAKNIVDGDKDVRCSTRGLYEAFAVRFPLQGHKLYEQFPSQTQRTITTDRQEKLKAAKPQSKKRKSP